ncbi:MAG TPA: oxygenase MpaB family protein [Solirubrobacteraceae bacterium]
MLTRAPLGPGSLTWKYFADIRGALLTQRAGVLQVMHPAIAAALVDHSDVFENPMQRLIRSAGPILGVVYDEDGKATARWVRDQHPPIRGHDAQGRRYHALDPDTYYWAHATFFESQIATQELFGTPLTTAEKEQLYAESITWYARYGLSMRPVPPDYQAFQRYWRTMFEDVLEPTSIARAAVRTTRDLPAPHPAIEGVVWAAARPLISRGGPWLTRGSLPPPAQEMLGTSWSRADQLALDGLCSFVRTTWPIVPTRMRQLPRAADATRRGQQ